MADLFALVYVSIASHDLSLTEIGRLLDGARRRNAQEDVTGVLLYAQGNFMQCLEGPAAGLARVYDVIRSDPLHYGLIEIVREPLRRREFGDWSMAFRVVGAFGPASAATQEAALTDKLLSYGAEPSPSRIVLSNFWNRGRAASAGTLRERSPDLTGRGAAAAAATPSDD